MSKISGVLSVIAKVVSIFFMLTVGLVSLASAYIIFAPDEYPKPFHLMYSYATPTPVAEVTPTFEPTVEPVEAGEGVMFNMSTKIINLADPTGRKYIRLTVVLEFDPNEPELAHMAEEEHAEVLTSFQEKINARMPIMDDAVITLLSTKTFEDLYTSAGKETLRQEVITEIAERIPEYHLISVYFTEFVVQ
jgi:flagellar FliL protein